MSHIMESSTEAEDPSRRKKQQLSKGMEHIRSIVTSTPEADTESGQHSPGAPNLQTDTKSSTATADTDLYFNTNEPLRVPPHRSHSPSNNQKRASPFTFGSRYLSTSDDLFEFNAWDHVPTDDAYASFASSQYALQRASPVSDFDRNRFNADPAKFWNVFYRHNAANFFKDRTWLHQEFPELARVTAEDAGPQRVLEVGAGAGNTAFPILKHNRNPQLELHAVDFSQKAVDVMRSSDLFDAALMRADVWDLASPDGTLPPHVARNSVDVAILIFTLSALAPQQWRQAVANVRACLKPGGLLLLRDYGRGDLAQVRFRKGRWMEENFYVRGDGTRVYFFEAQELGELWGGRRGRVEVHKKVRAAERSAAAAVAAGVDPKSASQEAKQVVEEEGAQEANIKADGEEDVAADGEQPFDVVEFGVDRRMMVNRQRRLKMHRCWMQGKFRKPGMPETMTTKTTTIFSEKEEETS